MNSVPRAAWTDRLFYSFDIESTNADPLLAHLATATLVKMDKATYQDKREWIARPAVPMPAEATEINGLTEDFLNENGRDAKTVVSEILDMVEKILKAGIPLVVFNAAYDMTMLEKQAEYYGLTPLRDRISEEAWNVIIDPFVLAKGYEHYWIEEFVKGRNFKLPSLCERYGVPFTESHDATADAIGAALLAIELVNRDEVMSTKGPQAMVRLHRNWRRKNQSSLRRYFDKNEIEHDGVDEGWPLHSSLTGGEPA